MIIICWLVACWWLSVVIIVIFVFDIVELVVRLTALALLAVILAVWVSSPPFVSRLSLRTSPVGNGVCMCGFSECQWSHVLLLEPTFRMPSERGFWS